MIQKEFNTQEISMDMWPYWMFEENINIVNEILEENDKHQKNSEEEQKANLPNMDTSSFMKNASNLTSNLNIPKF